jgi:hypothetical protein
MDKKCGLCLYEIHYKNHELYMLNCLKIHEQLDEDLQTPFVLVLVLYFVLLLTLFLKKYARERKQLE